MKKSLFVFSIMISMLITMMPICSASEDQINKNVIVHYPEIFEAALPSETSNYDVAVSNMLQMGWSMKEIADLPEKMILDYADAQSTSKSTKYFCYCADESDEEYIVEMKKDQFDYHVNQEKSKINDGADVTQLSSTGKLAISNIWSTSTDLNQYNSTGYLKQDQYLAWEGNNTFLNSYRWEWVIHPVNTREDVFYLTHQDNTTMIQDSENYVYKYDFALSNDTIVSETYESYTPVTYSYDGTSGVAYTVNLKDPEAYVASDGFINYRYTNHRGYMSYRTVLNNSNVTATSAAGGYIHCTKIPIVSPSVSFSGLDVSVSPSYAFVDETPGTYCSTRK